MRASFALVVVAAVASAACTSERTVGQPNLSIVQQSIDLTPRTNVDILFMVDDSNSMAPKQQLLRANFATLMSRVQALAGSGATASFHIGVVDSDLGAPHNAQACAPIGDGDGGLLRTAAAAATSFPAPANCSGFQLSADTPYIDYDSATGTTNTGSLSVGDAFTCLASVGDQGCGFEAQLESVYRALTTPGINPGFLRDDSLLVIVWVTDEDDCSVPPDSTLFENTPAAMASYGILQSFRCTQFGVRCNGNALDGTALENGDCTPAPGGLMYDVSRYIQAFGNGGIKADAGDVLLVSIAAPPKPFGVTVSAPCAGQPTLASCPELEHSCTSSSNPLIMGDPAVRINAVLASTVNSVSGSICDDDYSSTLAAAGDAMGARMRAGCLPGAVVDFNEPGCEVTIAGAGAPRCDASGRQPCWDIVQDNGCPQRMTPGGSIQQLRFTVQGAGGSSTQAVCPLYEPST